MSDTITFAFVKSENLKREFFQVPQATVEIEVEGAEDPLTHQRMRDAVESQFKATQAKINEFIKTRDLQIARLGVNERKRNQAALIKNGNESLGRFLADFKREAQEELEAFARQESETAQQVKDATQGENWKTVRWVVSVSWSGVKAIGGLAGAVASGGAATPLAIKEFVDSLMDLKQLFEDLSDHYATLTQTKKRVREALAALKSKPRITNSEVEAFANLVKLYEGKILAMEVKARAISSKVNAALKAVPQKGIKPEARRRAEEALDKSLKELVECSVSIKAAQRYLATVKKNLATARATAKSDPALTAVKNWAVAAYGKINDFKDIVFDPLAVGTWLDGAMKYFGDTRNVLEA